MVSFVDTTEFIGYQTDKNDKLLVLLTINFN